MAKQPTTVRKTGAKSLSALNCSPALGAEGRRFESFRPDHSLVNSDKHLAACSLVPHHKPIFLTESLLANGEASRSRARACVSKNPHCTHDHGYNHSLSTCVGHRDNSAEPPNSCVSAHRVSGELHSPIGWCPTHRKRSSLEAFCVSGSGRPVTQRMAECRRRTQDSDGALTPGAPAFRRDRTEPAIDASTSGPRYGRWEVECDTSVSGRPQTAIRGWPMTTNAESRGSPSPSEIKIRAY